MKPMSATTQTAQVVRPCINTRGKKLTTEQQHRSHLTAQLLGRRLRDPGEAEGESKYLAIAYGHEVLVSIMDMLCRDTTLFLEMTKEILDKTGNLVRQLRFVEAAIDMLTFLDQLCQFMGK